MLEPIRKLFAAEPLARERRYTAGTFSFNSGDGRCPACAGTGFEHVEMQFLSDVYLRCPDCNGRRYRSEVLEVKLALGAQEPKSIADVLDMTVADALVYFGAYKEVRARLQPLLDVGLEYMSLGQPVPTLSGGEAQRLKLAGELAESSGRGPTLYLFDEPTTGLHFADVEKLVGALDRLVAAGHSVLVIEHNLDVIAAADWLIDLGPEGGDAGGYVVAAGTPDDVRATADTHTARALREYAATLAGGGGLAEAASHVGIREESASPSVGSGEEASRFGGHSEPPRAPASYRCRGRRESVPGGSRGAVPGAERPGNGMTPTLAAPSTADSDAPPASSASTAANVVAGSSTPPSRATPRAGGVADSSAPPASEAMRVMAADGVREAAPGSVGARDGAAAASRDGFTAVPGAASRGPSAATATPKRAELIEIVHAREHNLRNVDLAIPRDKLTVVTGVSGSGKSTVAFDILFAEGQRRYLESLNAYARQFVEPAGRADVDAVYGIPPTVAIEQRTSRGGRKSTVATLTEIYHFLRLLFVKLGVQHCPDCGDAIDAQSVESIHAKIMSRYRGKRVVLAAPLVIGRKGYYTELAEWASARGYATLHVDGVPTPTDEWPRLDRFKEHDIELPVAELDVTPAAARELANALERALGLGRNMVRVLEVGAAEGAAAGVSAATSGAKAAGVSVAKTAAASRPKSSLVSAETPSAEGLERSAEIPSTEGRRAAADTTARKSSRSAGGAAEPRAARKPTRTAAKRSRERRIAAAARRAPPSGERLGPGELFSTERACPSCGRSFEPLDPRLFSYNSRYGWCQSCFGTGVELAGFDAEQTGEEAWWSEAEADPGACEACGGRRLKPEALAVTFRDRDIGELTELSVADALEYFKDLRLENREREIARDVLPELASRLGFLDLVGLGYLTLDRAAPTLSGGEAQRIRLAAQLGSNLRGVCYILDEPTIGLHPRDNGLLLDTIERLAAKGNTIVVVEHDEDTIRRAEHVVDLGPGAGRNGGEVVVNGTLDDLLASERSITGRVLASPPQHPLQPRRPVEGKPSFSRAAAKGGAKTRSKPKAASQAAAPQWLTLRGVTRHNLRKLDVALPLARLVCVTGVSGSGKSTLVRDVLHDNLARLVAGRGRRGRAARVAHCTSLDGWQSIGRVLEVDQTPIGKTPRSCPATYVGIWDEVRKLYAGTTEARLRGYDASRFSFNVSGGRCEGCEGQGLKKIEMSFLPDVRVACDRCGGKRFNLETLAVEFRGQSAGDVLGMTVDEAVAFFASHPKIAHTLALLRDVGLGYLTLGQQSPTLSGGEAQRVKLVTELAKVRPEHLRARPSEPTLYVLDEPTIGLHIADVEKLTRVLHRLVDAGNSVIVIEHNLDVLAEADWIVDLGPEGGEGGGKIIAEDTPERLAQRARTHTAKALEAFFATRRDTTALGPHSRAR